MEGEQKFTISLDAPLDINSNDMLVPASAPKFSFNRQRFLGNVLQNSVRYEADGWFAGWWVHNFDFVTLGDISISPSDIGFPTLQDKLIPGQLLQKYWSVKFNDVKLQFYFNTQLYKVDIEGTSTIARIDDQTVRIAGTTTGAQTYTVDVNAYTGIVIPGTFSSSDPALVPSGYLAGGIFNLTVAKPVTLGDDMVYLRWGSNLLFEDKTYAYSYDGTAHKWGGFFAVTGDTLSLVDNTAYDLDGSPGWSLENAGLVNEYFEVHLRSKGNFVLTDEVSYRLIAAFDRFYGFIRAYASESHLVDKMNTTQITGPDAVNTEDIIPIYYSPVTPVLPLENNAVNWQSLAVIGWIIPTWLKIGQNFNVRFEFDIYDRHILAPGSQGEINSWYECELYLYLGASDKASSYQNVIQDLNVIWAIRVNGVTYYDNGIPGGRIKLWEGDSRNCPTTWEIYLAAINNNADSTGFPLPYWYFYGDAYYNMEIHVPTWTEIPPPPPKWYTENITAEYWTQYIHPVEGPPAGWANPIPYNPWPAYWPVDPPAAWVSPYGYNPSAWAAKPGDWANPVGYNQPWSAYGAPAQPSDWENPVGAYGSVLWPATPPTGWTAAYGTWGAYTSDPAHVYGDISTYTNWDPAAQSPTAYSQAQGTPAGWPSILAWPATSPAGWTPPWPPAWPYGVLGIPATEPGRLWFSATTSYAAYLPATPPAGWPVVLGMQWPVTPPGGWTPASGKPVTWDPPWPPNWPWGISDLPFAEWFSGTPYNAWATANQPSNWPVTKPFPFVPALPWTARVPPPTPPDYTSDVNTDPPPGWSGLPWPPQWYFGVEGLPLDEWFDTTQTYEQYVIANKIPGWPLPWGWTVSHLQAGFSTWPFHVTDGGWVHRTGNQPYNMTVNANPPSDWVPDWPIWWPYDIANAPPEWYSTSISHYDWVLAHDPFKDVAADWNTGGDPGFAWPGRYFIHAASAFPSKPAWEYPLQIAGGFWSGDPASNTPITFSTTRPANWPRYVTVDVPSRGHCVGAYLGGDQGWPYHHFIRNRQSVYFEDWHLFYVDWPEEFHVTSYLRCIFPICISGWTINLVNTVDITLSTDGTPNKASFAMRPYANSEYGCRYWRIDDNNGQAGSGLYALDTVRAEIKSVVLVGSDMPVHGIPSQFEMLIGYDNYNLVDFDKTAVYQFPRTIEEATQQITDIQSQTPKDFKIDRGFYPEWITPSRGGTEYWSTYSDISTDAGIAQKLLLTMTFLEWMLGTTAPAVTYSPSSPTNDRFAQNLNQASLDDITPTGQSFPWAPGLFLETLRYHVDKTNTVDVDINYNVLYQIQTYSWNKNPPTPWEFDGATPITFTHEKIPRVKHTIKIMLKRSDVFILQLYRALIITKTGLMVPAYITAADQLSVTFNTGYGTVSRDGKYTNHPAVEFISSEQTADTITLYVTTPNRSIVQYVPEGIFWYNKIVKYISLTRSGTRWILRFEYEGTEYTLTIGDNVTIKLNYSVTDIRDGIVRDLYAQSTSDLQMVIKQFWSSNVDIENFWWYDSTHVLALTKYDMQLWEKTVGPDGEFLLDDWNGDRWHIVKSAPRGNFLEAKHVYYGMTSAKDANPAFIRMSNNGSSIAIGIIRDIATCNFDAPVWEATTVSVGTWALDPTGATPTTLGTSTIGAFVPIDINSLLCSGRISSTVTQNKLIIGFAMSRGMLQWAVSFDLSNPITVATVASVVNGYGHVGHDGALTGGQYPTEVCDANGFHYMVYSSAGFKDYDATTNPIEAPDEKVFCSGTSLWFVFKQLNALVSHYILVNGTFVKQEIPLQNNYTSVFGLSGAKGSALFDTIPKPMGLVDLMTLGDSSNNALVSALSYFNGVVTPSLWFMQPVMVSAVLAAEALHQAAYVVRNSLPVKSDDGKSDKDVTVVRKSKEMSITLDIGNLQVFVSLIIGLAANVISNAPGGELKIEESKGGQTPDDTSGRKLGQFATQAILNSISTAISSKGLVFSVKTKAAEIMSLSMFYTVNDGAECWAGPGFVNHNFIGQAVAQGVSIARFKLEKFGAYMPLPFVSTLLTKMQYLTMEIVNKAIDAVLNNMAGGTLNAYGLGSGAQVPIGMITGAIMNAAKTASDITLAMWQYMDQVVVPAMYQMLGTEGRGFYGGGIEKNVVEPEATHSYGNKPMSMFWPAFISEPATHIKSITVESIDSDVIWENADIRISGYLNCLGLPNGSDPQNTFTRNDRFFTGGNLAAFEWPFTGDLYFPKDVSKTRDAVIKSLPVRMSVVEGIVNMLPPPGTELKNLQVNCCDYTFPAPPIQDYEISQSWGVGVQAANGEIIAYSMQDIKLMDGPASNIVERDSFFGIASSYTALELKKDYDPKYLRPWAITPTAIALNINLMNVVQGARAYHGFDGQFNRITDWKGGNGLDSATMVQQYCFQVNDHFKRSNIIPPSEFFGLFNGPPIISMSAYGTDKVANQVMDLTRQKGMDINIPGEDRDLTRFSVPVHSEMLSTLPATVRMLAPYKLNVVEGITSLTTDIRSTQTKYKAPSSVDFNLYDIMYRATDEYVALLTLQDGVVAVEDKVPSAGLSFIGATTEEAFFYSPATRMYYSFSGSGAITKRDIFNRFKDIRNGRWDFVNQEVIFKMLLDDNILHDDVDGYFVARLDQNNVRGEIYPPNATVYNERSDFKILSMAGGLVYQGPKRCVVNRWVITDDMYPQIRSNKKKWRRLEREAWRPGRIYMTNSVPWKYEDWNTEAPYDAIYGWTHNPWRAATAMLGISEETDCLFEWEITFAWTEQVNNVFEQDEYMTFNMAGETIGQGGTLMARPTHLFLHKGLFKNGYYTTRYSSKNGMGNRERLYMWGDGMVAVESLSLYVKEMTTQRAQPIAMAQIDVQPLTEQ